MPVREDYLVLDPKDVPQHVDENTIGVVSIFGSTYNGQFEDVKALDAVVGELAQPGWPHLHLPLPNTTFYVYQYCFGMPSLPEARCI